MTAPRGWRKRIRRMAGAGGALFAVAVFLVGTAAALSANNLLFLVLATMLSVLLISGFISRLCLAGLELDFALPEHVAAGRTVAATLAVRNVKSWMPSFSIRVGGVEDDGNPRAILRSSVYFPLIPGGATLEEPVDVRFARRGQYRQDSFEFCTSFPFGFREKRAVVVLSRELVVYPSIDPRPGFEELLAGLCGDLDAHHRGRSGEFYRIRPYESQESARHVDWKASAHTGDLQVREFAREQERQVEIFFDRNVPAGSEEWFEQAIDCCAFLVWRLAQQVTGVRFSTQDYQVRVPEDGDVYTILKYLALVAPAAGRAPGPIDAHSFQILFSASPQLAEAVGWTPARVVAPGDIAVSARRPGDTAAFG